MADTKINARYKAVNQDFHQLMKDAEMLFEEAATLTGEKANAVRQRGMEYLEVAMNKLHAAQTTVINSGKEMTACTDDYVKKNPWRSVGAAAGVGVLIGLLIGRK